MGENNRLPRLDRSNISAQVYGILRERIFSRQFAPGERLNLPEIEEQMDISRTPLKNALGRLSIEGLVEIIPRSGTFVTNPTREDIEEVFDVRQVLEEYAIKLAAERITPSALQQLCELAQEMRQLLDTPDKSQIYPRYTRLDYAFHHLIVKCAESKQLAKLWEQVNAHVQMARIRYRSVDGEIDLSMSQHLEICELFGVRDSDALQQLVGYHISRAKQALLNDLDDLSNL